MVFGQFCFRSCSQHHIFIVFLFKAEKKRSNNFTELKEPVVMDSAAVAAAELPALLGGTTARPDPCQTSQPLA